MNILSLFIIGVVVKCVGVFIDIICYYECEGLLFVLLCCVLGYCSYGESIVV